MNIEAVAWAFEWPTSSVKRRLTLALLASCADATGLVARGAAALDDVGAAKCMTRDAIDGCILRLASDGALIVSPGEERARPIHLLVGKSGRTP